MTPQKKDDNKEFHDVAKEIFCAALDVLKEADFDSAEWVWAQSSYDAYVNYMRIKQLSK